MRDLSWTADALVQVAESLLETKKKCQSRWWSHAPLAGQIPIREECQRLPTPRGPSSYHGDIAAHQRGQEADQRGQGSLQSPFNSGLWQLAVQSPACGKYLRCSPCVGAPCPKIAVFHPHEAAEAAYSPGGATVSAHLCSQAPAARVSQHALPGLWASLESAAGSAAGSDWRETLQQDLEDMPGFLFPKIDAPWPSSAWEPCWLVHEFTGVVGPGQNLPYRSSSTSAQASTPCCFIGVGPRVALLEMQEHVRGDECASDLCAQVAAQIQVGSICPASGTELQRTNPPVIFTMCAEQLNAEKMLEARLLFAPDESEIVQSGSEDKVWRAEATQVCLGPTSRLPCAGPPLQNCVAACFSVARTISIVCCVIPSNRYTLPAHVHAHFSRRCLSSVRHCAAGASVRRAALPPF